jgi:hypothetical protein
LTVEGLTVIPPAATLKLMDESTPAYHGGKMEDLLKADNEKGA